jgi:hypothetical protein
MAEALDQDLVSYINGKMLTYYVKQEFENAEQKKNSIKTRAKSKAQSAPHSVRNKQPV